MSGGLSPHLRELSKTLAPEYGPETPSEAVSRLLEYYQRLDGPRLVELDAFQQLVNGDAESASDLRDQSDAWRLRLAVDDTCQTPAVDLRPSGYLVETHALALGHLPQSLSKSHGQDGSTIGEISNIGHLTP